MMLINFSVSCRRMKHDPYILPCTTLNSKWIKGLNRRHATLNLLQEKVLCAQAKSVSELAPKRAAQKINGKWKEYHETTKLM